MSNRTIEQLSMPKSKCCVQPRSLVHDVDTNKYFLEIRFRDVDGGFQSLLASRDLQQSPGRIVEELLKHGAVMPSDPRTARQVVGEAIAEPPPRQRMLTRRRGWHDDSFVTSNRTYGPLENVLTLERDVSIDPGLDLRAGDLITWKEGIRSACEGSSYLTFAVALAFSAPLLALVGEGDGCIYVFSSESTTGKSLSGRLTESVQGRASAGDIASFEITNRAVEELCSSRNDAAVVIDETGRARSVTAFRDQLRKWAYQLTSGKGAVRV
jgi:putative DNA primase/helicase